MVIMSLLNNKILIEELNKGYWEVELIAENLLLINKAYKYGKDYEIYKHIFMYVYLPKIKENDEEILEHEFQISQYIAFVPKINDGNMQIWKNYAIAIKNDFPKEKMSDHAICIMESSDFNNLLKDNQISKNKEIEFLVVKLLENYIYQYFYWEENNEWLLTAESEKYENDKEIRRKISEIYSEWKT